MNYVSSQSFHTLHHWQSSGSGEYVQNMNFVLKVVKEAGGEVWKDCPAILDKACNYINVWGNYQDPDEQPYHFFKNWNMPYFRPINKKAANPDPPPEGAFNLDRTNEVWDLIILGGSLSTFRALPILIPTGTNHVGTRDDDSEAIEEPGIFTVYNRHGVKAVAGTAKRIPMKNAKEDELACITDNPHWNNDFTKYDQYYWWDGTIQYGIRENVNDRTIFTPKYNFKMNTKTEASGGTVTYTMELIYISEVADG